jgi:hypothetical protein
MWIIQSHSIMNRQEERFGTARRKTTTDEVCLGWGDVRKIALVRNIYSLQYWLWLVNLKSLQIALNLAIASQVWRLCQFDFVCKQIVPDMAALMQRMTNAKCTSVLNVDKEHFRAVKFIRRVWPAMKTSRHAGTWTTRGARKATRVAIS